MKKIYVLSLVLVCIIAVSTIIFAKALCEDDDPVFDSLCNPSNILHYNELVLAALTETGLFYEQHSHAFSLKPIISYLERQEKSPPHIPMAFPTV